MADGLKTIEFTASTQATAMGALMRWQGDFTNHGTLTIVEIVLTPLFDKQLWLAKLTYTEEGRPGAGQ